MSQATSRISEQELLQHGIEEAVRLTGSEVGYLYLVNDDQESVQLVAWSAGTLNSGTAASAEHYPISQARVWADSVRRMAPVIRNDYHSTPGRHGYPEGHVHLSSLICVPVVELGKVRMLLGVGNKGVDYNDSDVRELQLIGNELWRIYTSRRVELRLAEAKEAAEATSRIKTAFLANMNHEIRTPMNAIIGLTHLLRRSVSEPKQAEQLDMITDAAQHLLVLLNDILDMSEIEAGRLQIEEDDFDIEQLVDNIINLVAVD